jgi:hypothetical protein
MTTLEVPALPGGDQVPAAGELVTLLARAVPEGDRRAATGLLTDIVSAKLAGIATHPRPRRLAEVAYEEVAETLRAVHPEDRLVALQRAALQSRAEELGRGALSLAVARYLKDHPDAEKGVEDWLDESVESWRRKSVSEMQAEATRRLDNLEKWAKQAQQDGPTTWEQERITYAHAKLALQSARSGAFGTAAGSLNDFLKAAGARPQSLDIH